MRAWKVIGKYRIYDDDGNISHTDIAITSTTGLPASYTERVLGDHSKKSDEELIKLAHEEHFKSEYSDRAMAESVQKIDELEQAKQRTEKFISDAEKKFDEFLEKIMRSEQERNKQFALLNGSFTELMLDYYASKEAEDELDSEFETSDVDGSDSTTDNTESE